MVQRSRPDAFYPARARSHVGGPRRTTQPLHRAAGPARLQQVGDRGQRIRQAAWRSRFPFSARWEAGGASIVWLAGTGERDSPRRWAADGSRWRRNSSMSRCCMRLRMLTMPRRFTSFASSALRIPTRRWCMAGRCRCMCCELMVHGLTGGEKREFGSVCSVSSSVQA